jgi:hypothetical protein
MRCAVAALDEMEESMDHKASSGNTTRRRWTAVVVALMAAAVTPASAQEVPPLRPNEAIAVPGGSITMLAADIQTGEPTAVTLRVRAFADAKSSLALRADTFRLVAAGVPRVPAAPIYVNVAPDSAEDFVLAFKVADKTDDLVLQMRFGDTVVRRRLPKR